MKIHSKNEIIEKVASLIPKTNYIEFKVIKNKPEIVQIHFENMYEYCPMSFQMLMKLSEFFDTKNINDDDRYHSNGCETCDYGSVYKFTLTIRPEKSS